MIPVTESASMHLSLEALGRPLLEGSEGRAQAGQGGCCSENTLSESSHPDTQAGFIQPSSEGLMSPQYIRQTLP